MSKMSRGNHYHNQVVLDKMIDSLELFSKAVQSASESLKLVNSYSENRIRKLRRANDLLQELQKQLKDIERDVKMEARSSLEIHEEENVRDSSKMLNPKGHSISKNMKLRSRKRPASPVGEDCKSNPNEYLSPISANRLMEDLKKQPFKTIGSRPAKSKPKISMRGNSKSIAPVIKVPRVDQPIFKVGDVVMAKLRFFPYWPAVVLDPRDSSVQVLFWEFRNDKCFITTNIVPSSQVVAYLDQMCAKFLNRDGPNLEMETAMADDLKHMGFKDKLISLCRLQYSLNREAAPTAVWPDYGLGDVVMVNDEDVGIVTPEPFLSKFLRERHWIFDSYVYVTLVSSKGAGFYSESNLLPDPATFAPAIIHAKSPAKMKRRIELAKRYSAMNVEERLKLPNVRMYR